MPEYGLRDDADGDKASTGPDRRTTADPAALSRNRSVVRYLPDWPNSGCRARVDCLERPMILMRGPWPTALCTSLRPTWLIRMPCTTRRSGRWFNSKTRALCCFAHAASAVRDQRCEISAIGLGAATLIVPRASPIGHEVDEHLMQLSAIAQDSGAGLIASSMPMLQGMDARSSLQRLGNDRGNVDVLAALLLIAPETGLTRSRARAAACATVSRLRRSRLSSGSRRTTPW
jgi:hypothetical protein